MNSHSGILSPLRHGVFRRIWTASLLSNLGLMIMGVGAAWSMTQMTASSDKVALVQTALMLPVALISAPAGAVADMFDRRKVGLVALSLAFGGAPLLTGMAWLNAVTPSLLLLFCFITGSGMALFGPAWQASVGEQVPSESLPSAIALNGISYNIARSFGRAIVRQPRAFLFDEPLSNLDAELRVQMRIEIARLHQQLGATMIYVTHDQVEAMTLADRIVVLRSGVIEQQGSPIEVYDNPDNQFVAGFIGSPRMNFLDAVVRTIKKDQMTVELTGFEADALTLRRRGKGGSVGQSVRIGIRPEHFVPPVRGAFRLAANAQVTEQLGGVSFIYAVGRDDTQKLTVQHKGRVRIAAGAKVEVGIEPDNALAFDAEGMRI